MSVTSGTDHHRATCRCGHVRLRASGRPLVTSACHCTGCRRMTGGPYSLGAIYAANAVVVEAGETRAIGADHGAGHQGCPRCASWVFRRPREVGDIVVVRSSLFEDAAAFPPFMETCTSEKLPFVDFTAPYRFARFPDPTEFPALIAAYAAWDQVEV